MAAELSNYWYWHALARTSNAPLSSVVSPGFVARRGKDGNCHGALTVDFRAGCSSCSMTKTAL